MIRFVSRRRCFLFLLTSTAAACSRRALLRNTLVGCIRPDVRLRVLLAGGPAARVLDLVFRAGAAGLTAARALLALRFLLVAGLAFGLVVGLFVCVFTLGAAGVNAFVTRCISCRVIDRV